MKKVLLFVAVTGFFALTSCKKDYTCECVTVTAGVSATTSSTINGKKKDVEEACESGNSSVTVGGITTSVTCSIK